MPEIRKIADGSIRAALGIEDQGDIATIAPKLYVNATVGQASVMVVGFEPERLIKTWWMVGKGGYPEGENEALAGDQGDKMTFMAYTSGGETYVRANLCPPCRSVGFSLAGDVLVCDSCGTRFKASTGEGITGACRDYPKAAVAYGTSGDRITMEVDDLVTAYLDTGKPGWP